jgi:hypothetical protein
MLITLLLIFASSCLANNPPNDSQITCQITGVNNGTVSGEHVVVLLACRNLILNNLTQT